jgi:hypothetical protein
MLNAHIILRKIELDSDLLNIIVIKYNLNLKKDIKKIKDPHFDNFVKKKYFSQQKINTVKFYYETFIILYQPTNPSKSKVKI